MAIWVIRLLATLLPTSNTFQLTIIKFLHQAFQNTMLSTSRVVHLRCVFVSKEILKLVLISYLLISIATMDLGSMLM